MLPQKGMPNPLTKHAFPSYQPLTSIPITTPSHPRLLLQVPNLLTRLRLAHAHALRRLRLSRLLRHHGDIPHLLPRRRIIAPTTHLHISPVPQFDISPSLPLSSLSSPLPSRQPPPKRQNSRRPPLRILDRPSRRGLTVRRLLVLQIIDRTRRLGFGEVGGVDIGAFLGGERFQEGGLLGRWGLGAGRPLGGVVELGHGVGGRGRGEREGERREGRGVVVENSEEGGTGGGVRE